MSKDKYGVELIPKQNRLLYIQSASQDDRNTFLTLLNYGKTNADIRLTHYESEEK